MRLQSVAVLAIVALFTAGCSATLPQKKEFLVTERIVYPELPDIQVPPIPPLLPFKFDVPRDMSRLEVKNTEECLSVPEDKRDEKFWNKCGIHPPLDDTNIFLGLDEESYNNLMLDLKMLQEHIITLRKIIEHVNEQRRKWRQLNEEARRQQVK